MFGTLGGSRYCLSGSCQQQTEEKVRIVYRDREPEPKPISTSKWLKPTNSVCEANGGKLYKGVCQANWKNATKICTESGGKLPTRAEFSVVVKNKF